MKMGSRKLSNKVPFNPGSLRGKRRGVMSIWRDIYKAEFKRRAARS